ncbi:MAG: NifU family protein [Burkholderiales bacterium]|nr:NifU family protein [Burkholderiales bacterium]
MSAPLKTDAPFYTEEELDRLELSDPVAALRIAREQAQLRRQLATQPPAGAETAAPDAAGLEAVLAEARQILRRDGGDIEFVSVENSVLTVRLKGSCSGCPRAPLDLKQVVEALVRRRYPQITEVRNQY